MTEITPTPLYDDLAYQMLFNDNSVWTDPLDPYRVLVFDERDKTRDKIIYYKASGLSLTLSAPRDVHIEHGCLMCADGKYQADEHGSRLFVAYLSDAK